MTADERDGLGALALDQLAQRHSREKAVYGGVQLLPKIVGHAAMAVVTVLAAATLRRVEGFLDGADDVRDAHLRRVACEAVAASGTAHALDQLPPAQLAEKLLEVGERDLLALADAGQGDRTRGAMEREIEHRGHREASFGRQSHDLPRLEKARGQSRAIFSSI